LGVARVIAGAYQGICSAQKAANLTARAAFQQNRRMPSVIERAPSGRAKCRACTQAISRGEMRFGEALPNAYGEGESLFWFHVRCAACARPEALLLALAESGETVPERVELAALAQAGAAQPRLSRILRAERASSGRAKCRHCQELIAQGAWRLALQMFEEGRFNPIGTIHAACAVGYFGVAPPIERLKLPSNELDTAELAEVVQLMQGGAAPALALPGLAKAPAPDQTTASTRKTS
jgi:Poly(ADP-ribose) polymerase and DNA-Ligase Zn-finger region